MARYTRTPVSTLQGINNELAKVELAMQDTLDRTGSTPNYMDNNLDMNSRRILNLPAPLTDQEPLRRGDVPTGLSVSAQYVDDKFADALALKIFQSPTDGGLTEIQTRTVNGGEVYEVRKTSDNSLATIYSNAAGTIEISQNGTDNKSGSNGVVEFYIDDGYYTLSAGSYEGEFTVSRFGFSSIKQFKAVADGIVDDSVSAQKAIDESAPVGISNVESDIENTYGENISQDVLMQNNTTGRLYNPQSSLGNYFFGQETLQHWFSLFSGASNKNSGNSVTAKIVCTGDSTTFGVGGTYGGVPAILAGMAKSRGYPNVEVVNKGRSGAPLISWPETNRATSWQANYLNEDIALDPDLLIVRWGANDPFYNVSPLGSSSGTPVHDRDTVLDKVIQGYRETLETLRSTAGMEVENLSIILATPGPMNDVFFGRDEIYFQRLSTAMKQMALDYQCAFIDIYGLFSNSWGGVGKWMDSDGTSGVQRAIHPHNELYEHIVGAIGELALPNYGLNWKVNSVRNTSGTTVNRLTTEAPNQFFAGINVDRMGSGVGSSLGKPYNGAALTFKQADGAIAQFNYPLKGFGAGMSARFGFGTFNNYWNGAVYKLSESGYANGWDDIGGDFEVGSYKLSISGTVELSGVLSAGTTTNGTTIFTLPVGFRPSKTVLCLAATELGDCLISINTSGTVSISRFGSGGNYISLNSVKFPVY